MSKKFIFYEDAVPVTKERHGDLSVKSGSDYLFAAGANAVPLTAVEIPAAASEYAVVFAGKDDAILPAAVLGIEAGRNHFVAPDGRWTGRYVPAFVRRYPFIFASIDGGTSFTLCIDESFAGCNREGRGERLFDADGEQTQYLRSVLSFLQEYQVHFETTRAFCRKLQELDLLGPMTARLRTATGEPRALTGFLAVDREKLRALPDDKLAALARSGELELAYVALHSMRQISRIARGLAGNGADPAQPPEPDARSRGGEATPARTKSRPAGSPKRNPGRKPS